MNILIISIDHYSQVVRKPDDSQELVDRKSRLESLLEREIPRRNVELISEESLPSETSIAYMISQAANPRIPWINILMTEEERSAAGIKEVLDHHPGHPDKATMSIWITTRVPEDIVRESFFIEETIKAAQEFQSILILLGDMHSDAVAKRLTGLGHTVEVNRDLIPVKLWDEFPEIGGQE